MAEKVTTSTEVKEPLTGSNKPSLENGPVPGQVLTHDEYHLATLGYKQEFTRCLGFFESWAATFSTMNFISGIVSPKSFHHQQALA